MTLPLTVIIPVMNEEKNLPRCLESLHEVERVVVVDSQSTDRTAEITREQGAELMQFHYEGGYPKKRQWALDTLDIGTPWVLLLDADEMVPDDLWNEIRWVSLHEGITEDAYFITKGFHFMGRRFRFGGFSFANILFFRTGKARFEELLEDEAGGLDMEVHERMIVDGTTGSLDTPLVHEDFNGLEAYLERHRRYADWEARLRLSYLRDDAYGRRSIHPSLFGSAQQRRRWLKMLVMRMPLEHWIWFFYHYVIRLGFLEGRPGWHACKIRAKYIRWVNERLAKLRRGKA